MESALFFCIFAVHLRKCCKAGKSRTEVVINAVGMQIPSKKKKGGDYVSIVQIISEQDEGL